jgi:hypothetical protein
MRYSKPNLLYSDKFNSVLRFFVPEEKEEKIKEKIVKKLIEVNRRPAQ